MTEPIKVNKWEEFVRKLLNTEDFTNIISTEGSADKGYDLTAIYQQKKILIELKLFRSKTVAIAIIRRALQYLSAQLRKGTKEGGLLVINADISSTMIDSLREEFGIEIIDRGRIYKLTEKNSELREAFENILRENTQSGEEDLFEGIQRYTLMPKFKFGTVKPGRSPAHFAKGERLLKTLKEVSPGTEEAAGYETICFDILQYIFQDDFVNWKTKKTKTTDTLHIFDCIARISSVHELWTWLARDFRSRYVVFEFKNYTNKIKQGQVYTTEKYLYRTALGSIAILISREGPDANAVTAMEGSLREYGKLIIPLDEEQLVEMVKLKMRNDDPISFLSELIDERLMKLSR